MRLGGDFQIHEKIEGNDEGYCGAVLDFLMEDGTIEKVKGPFYKYKDDNERILMDIIKAILNDELVSEVIGTIHTETKEGEHNGN